jgi:hypothetical protein
MSKKGIMKDPIFIVGMAMSVMSIVNMAVAMKEAIMGAVTKEATEEGMVAGIITWMKQKANLSSYSLALRTSMKAD